MERRGERLSGLSRQLLIAQRLLQIWAATITSTRWRDICVRNWNRISIGIDSMGAKVTGAEANRRQRRGVGRIMNLVA